jgi:hypothetical protein
MPAIVEYPQVVREAVDEFADLFSCEPQRRHFAEYLTGLMIAANSHKVVRDVVRQEAKPRVFRQVRFERKGLDSLCPLQVGQHCRHVPK